MILNMHLCNSTHMFAGKIYFWSKKKKLKEIFFEKKITIKVYFAIFNSP